MFTGAAGPGPFSLLPDPQALWLIGVSRLPRTAATLLAGSGLAVAGVIMQMLVGNRSVEPATAGAPTRRQVRASC